MQAEKLNGIGVRRLVEVARARGLRLSAAAVRKYIREGELPATRESGVFLVLAPDEEAAFLMLREVYLRRAIGTDNVAGLMAAAR